MAANVRWQQDPEDHDYPAAISYLSLLMPPADAKRVVAGMRDLPIEHFKAKDMLRASGLELLPLDNKHVAKDLAKVKSGKALSPVLLVRGSLRAGIALVIADGYHRVCASCHVDEDVDIPCRVADLAPHQEGGGR